MQYQLVAAKCFVFIQRVPSGIEMVQVAGGQYGIVQRTEPESLPGRSKILL